jgi:WD40 repeat protein
VRGLQFIDVASGHVLWKLPFAHPESARVWFSPDGRWLVVTPAHGPATEVWSVKDRRRVWQIETGVRDVAFSPNSRRLVTATPDGFLRVWDLFAGEQVVALQADAVVTRFRPDGHRLLIITLNGAVAWLDGMPADAGH